MTNETPLYIQCKNELNAIIERLDKLNEDLFPSLVWLWVWNTICDFYNDESLYIRTQDIVWDALHAEANSIGFTLEYGTEHLYEHIRDWMIESDLMIDIDNATEEEIKAWTADKEYGTYVQGR